MNQWPGVRLRVTEGWDEEGHHAARSLHYEGRAVDLTTSDKERSKYGMLARLAVEAGFDWVYYESRTHIHCSVKSESYGAARSGGCFHGSDRVQTRHGTKSLSELLLGDEVMALASDGGLVFTEVISFLDRDPSAERLFYRVETESGRTVSFTPAHLVYYTATADGVPRPTFAARLVPGGYILSGGSAGAAVDGGASSLRLERVRDVTANVATGVFAPLTREGTLLVNGVAASCYAAVEDQALAHWAFLPVRLWEDVKDSALSLLRATGTLVRRADGRPHGPQQSSLVGVHWYAELLYGVFYRLLPKSYLLD
ncbi:sonic hedgehog protein [Ixodes scapularis]|uniref:sonic hedgehog protein n=1 Tax=Ixodes scapularis TaxID=6945 RepID=UPI001C38804F|nr:sonic hedgehog protein [Ixodes scapularis]